jgi:tetratricopeptide (TPR) repeat protein
MKMSNQSVAAWSSVMRVVCSAFFLLLMLGGLSAPAAADDWSDCKFSVPERRIAACTRIINKRDEGPEKIALAHTYRGNAYRGREENELAIADFTKAMELDPKRAAYNRGLVSAIKGDHDKAIAEYDEAIKANPEDAAAYNTRGVSYNAKGDRERAIKEWSEAIRLDPNMAVAYLNRGNAYNNKGDRELAVIDAMETIRLDPNLPGGYTLRGAVYGAKGETDKAIADFTKAIALDPKLVRAYDNRATAYEKKGDLDRALADLTKAIEINPKIARTYDHRGVVYQRKSDLDYRTKASNAAPPSADSDKTTALAPKFGEPSPLAIADFTKAIELDPKFANAYNNRGIMHGRKGEMDKAIADYTSAIGANPKFTWPYNNRALAYARLGDVDKALADYEKVLELDPKYTQAYANRGAAYEKKGDNERAIADFRKVLELPAPTEADRQRQEVIRGRIARLTQTQAPRAATKAQAPAGQRVALVIGVSNYVNAGVLRNPPNDAKGMAAALRRLGFAKVVELYDPTREQMGKALKEFGDIAEGAEWALVFFAGHGMEMNGVTYLVPSDAALKRDTHVPDETISLTQVQVKVDAATKLGLVILDSCRNNPFLERMIRGVGATRGIGGGSRGLAEVEPEGNVLVAYSAKAGTTALDGAGANSPFTEAMLNHIEEPGLEINLLFRKVRDDVRAKTLRRQDPFVYGALSSELLYFKAPAKQ